jgi:hypothetical protein
VEYNNQPMMIMAGLTLDMVWDIMIRSIDPKLVKELVPDAHGLTSRLQDKDTGEMTLLGNMRLERKVKNLLHTLRAGEQRAQNLSASRVQRAVKKTKLK